MKGSARESVEHCAVIGKESGVTLQQLRERIPAHCFERSALRSSVYVLRDLLCAGLLWYFVAPLIDSVSAVSLRVSLWLLFAAVQGTILTGVWVVAHECGHGAFSESDRINNAVGLLLHSLLLVPFYSWKFTHAAHHGSTNHIKKDQVFVPDTAAKARAYSGYLELLEDTPILNFALFVRMFLLGWPFYLICNVYSNDVQQPASHFVPSSPIFTKEQRRYVTLSNYALLAVLGLFSVYIRSFGFAHFVTRYLLPYLVVNFWLVFYTFLQHTDEKVPHYSEKEWTYLRGALATIDRPYHAFDFFHHEIGTSHVMHHLFSRIPHYHAAEATRAVLPLLGKHYVYDPTNIFVAAWRNFCNCKFVDGEDVLWFRRSFRS